MAVSKRGRGRENPRKVTQRNKGIEEETLPLKGGMNTNCRLTPAFEAVLKTRSSYPKGMYSKKLRDICCHWRWVAFWLTLAVVFQSPDMMSFLASAVAIYMPKKVTEILLLCKLWLYPLIHTHIDLNDATTWSLWTWVFTRVSAVVLLRQWLEDKRNSATKMIISRQQCN